MLSRLTGPHLRRLRSIVLLVGTLTVVLYSAGVPLYFRDLTQGCLHTGCRYDLTVMPSPEQVAAIGFSVPVYSLLLVAIEVGTALLFYAVAALLFWQAPDNRVALLGAVCLLAGGATYTTPLDALVQAVPFFRWPVELLSVLGNSALYLFLMVVPTGHFVPRQMRWVWLAFTLLGFVFGLLPDDLPMSQNLWLLLPALVGLVALLLSPAFAQIYRYRRVSTPAEREQTKWVVFGVSVALVSHVTVILAGSLYEPEAVAVWGVVYHLAVHGTMLLIPVSLLGAIFLSRLWSIDVIIRRTLVYTLLSVALGLFYIAVVIVLQTLVVALTGESRSTLVTVLSTLAIAAVFSPLRAWLQRAVDQRFYRSRYSTSQTLARFGATLRDDLELDGLAGRLVHVVDVTMQPEHVSLWLKPIDEVEFSALRMDSR